MKKPQKPKRRYTLRARGTHVAGTRSRIVEAIMRLHEEVGPRHTTVSAIADRAGVQRLTVYRHFEDDASMFAACSQRYLELNPLPDPASWAAETDPLRRTKLALEKFYAFFTRTSAMFTNVYRDVEESPALREVMGQFDAFLRKQADALASAWPRDASSASRCTILRHAIKFATWQSLELDHVNNKLKVRLILAWVSSHETPQEPRRR